ncbi:MAG: hypothetical protein V4850_19760 [Myxococcota bacterium]
MSILIGLFMLALTGCSEDDCVSVCHDDHESCLEDCLEDLDCEEECGSEADCVGTCD